MSKERRILNFTDNQDKSVRAFKDDATGKLVIEGYGAVFGQRSKLIYEQGKFFYEIIDRQAFDAVLAEPDKLNVVLTRDHERTQILARTISGTLTLEIDEIGLKYRAELPNTELGRETYELVKRGDLFESSFIFTVTREGQTWKRDAEGNLERTIKSVRSLHDVAIVVDGAYSNTKIDVSEARNFIEAEDAEQAKKEQAEKIERAKRETELIKIKSRN